MVGLWLWLVATGCQLSPEQQWRDCGCTVDEVCVRFVDGTECVAAPEACDPDPGECLDFDDEACSLAVDGLCGDDRRVSSSCGLDPDGGRRRIVGCEA
ncbi:MAG: hypothetical protein AAGA48_26285 [Myxococcota bacterium]